MRRQTGCAGVRDGELAQDVAEHPAPLQMDGPAASPRDGAPLDVSEVLHLLEQIVDRLLGLIGLVGDGDGGHAVRRPIPHHAEMRLVQIGKSLDLLRLELLSTCGLIDHSQPRADERRPADRAIR